MRVIVMDAIDRWHEVLFALLRNRTTRVAIPVPAWEVGACDLQSDAVPSFEVIGRGPQVDMQFVDATRLHEHWRG